MKTITRDQHPATGETLRRKRRPLVGVIFVVIGGVIGIMGVALPKPAFADEGGLNPTIMILVYNYTQASPAMLAAAEREAGRILAAAGVRSAWFECPMGPPTAGPQGPCQKAPDDTEIRLRVLAAPIPRSIAGHPPRFCNPSIACQCLLRPCRASRED